MLQRLTDRLPERAVQHQRVEIFALLVMHQALGRGAIDKRLASGSLLHAAREILRALAGCLGLWGPKKPHVQSRRGVGFAELVLQALGAAPGLESIRTMNAILVWMADHELSLRTLSARVAACSGACVHSGVRAAMSVSSGTEVAWLSNNIGQFVKSARSVSALLRKGQEFVESGLGVPGFDHPLYPNDPRARCLLTLMKARGRWTGRASKRVALSDFMAQHYGLHPRHE